mgnify:CR=1 FL=1
MSSRFLDLVLSQNKEDLDIKVRNDKKFFHKSQVSFSARENPSIYRLLNRRLDRKSIVAALPPVRTYSLQRAGKLTNSPKRVPVMGGQKRGRRTRKIRS